MNSSTVSGTPAFPNTIQPIPPSDVLARIRTFEQTALAKVLHWGPLAAAALIVLGGIILLLGLLFGARNWRSKGITIAAIGPLGYLAAVALLRVLLYQHIRL